MIQRAFDNNVKGFLLPGADINDLQRAKEIAYRYENTYFASGVHPYHASDYDEKILREFLEDDRCIAVGECGLDYYRLSDDKREKEEEKRLQKEVFIKHISLAKEVKKP